MGRRQLSLDDLDKLLVMWSKGESVVEIQATMRDKHRRNLTRWAIYNYVRRSRETGNPRATKRSNAVYGDMK